MTVPNDSQAPPALTGRQGECMRLVGKGLTAKQIARELGISPRTVEQHLAAAIEALGVPNRSAAVARLHQIERKNGRATSAAPFMLGEATPVDASLVADIAPAPPPADRGRAQALPILPPLGGAPNTVGPQGRRVWMIRIAIVSTMLSCLAILSVLALTEMVNWTSV